MINLIALLTKKEHQLLAKRFQIVKLLKTKLTYRDIAKQMTISTTTVVRLNQRLKIRKKRNQRIYKTTQNQNKKKRLPWIIG